MALVIIGFTGAGTLVGVGFAGLIVTFCTVIADFCTTQLIGVDAASGWWVWSALTSIRDFNGGNGGSR